MTFLLDSTFFSIPGFSTALLHGVMGVLTFILTLFFFISYLITKKTVSKKLTLFFLFFTLYSLSVTFSIVLFPGNMQTAGWGIVIGLYFVMLVAMMGFDTPLFYKHFLFEKNAGRIRIIFAMAWGLFSLYGILFPQLPEVGFGNFMYWNMAPICKWGLTFLTFCAAFGWGYIYSGSAQYAEGKSETYIKMRTFSIDGFLWAIAGPGYIIAADFWSITIAFIIMITTFLATASVFSYYRFFGNKTPLTTINV